LDVQFREDQARNRKKKSAENMAIVRHMALNLLKKGQTSKKKVSIRSKRLLAGWDNQFMLDLLACA
jgi:hypothetical protein